MTRRSIPNPVWPVAVLALFGLFALYGWDPAAGLSGGQIVATLADGREGEVRFESHDANWRQINSGQFEDQRVLIDGKLTMPAQSEGRVPAVVLLHGSDGLSRHQLRYAKLLAEWGMATFVVDSFGPRGVQTTVGNQDAVTAYSMLIDAYAALALLATHPDIDSDRIAVIGWSKGGTVADWASRRYYRDLLAPTGLRFAAHVAFYPWCGEQDFRIKLTRAPLLFLLGELDDWTGTRACQDYAERVAAAGYRAKAVTYPNAHHGFDYEGRFLRSLRDAESWADCAYFVRDDGFTIAATGRFERWSNLNRYLHQCAKPGAHAGSNADARKSAYSDLHKFLSNVLKL